MIRLKMLHLLLAHAREKSVLLFFLLTNLRGRDSCHPPIYNNKCNNLDRTNRWLMTGQRRTKGTRLAERWKERR